MKQERADFVSSKTMCKLWSTSTNSVFECIVDGAQCRMLKGKLQEIIDEEKDSIRIYYLNDKQKQKIECLGVKKGISVENTLIF